MNNVALCLTVNQPQEYSEPKDFWYVSKFRRVLRTEFQCPLCGKVGAVEVFQPRLVIFRAEPSIDASIRTFVPSKCVSSLVPRQSSTNFSMTDPGAMNNHI